MTTLTQTVARAGAVTAPQRVRRRLTSRVASAVAIVIAVLWTTPTFGLLLSSLRPEDQIKSTGWWTFFSDPQLTLENYQQVLFGTSSSSGQMASFLINSVVITIPSVLLPLALATFAAYALAWLPFRGREWIYIGVFALQIVPLQMALVPLLSFFSQGVDVFGVQVLPAWDLEGPARFVQVWFAHTCFALPLGIFLIHNFMAELPGELMEAARVDGASHGTVLRKLVLPLVGPALASFGIFQFLWVWNDLLVALIFAGGTAENAPMTVRLAQMAGTKGNEWQRLTSGAFVSVIIPLIVFLSMQRYFVRGLLAGSVKG
ncbi:MULTISPECIES: carbohydrate ABC transporter permease [Streptosporangium]|uniref:Alpha-glucoside transport system permease protein n=1 Tax=Streptosporangium brasiliense TaxID=47480 RepID=A0ABT9RBM1_9ACTN|nr:carbohydrate ABC transporter permease [Streptosporangium brasiliense]MDP9866257.1 alpha-glucoside transport system permease protein [Streptosporangium brasiliense]